MKVHRVALEHGHVQVYELCAAALYLYSCMCTSNPDTDDSKLAVVMFQKAMRKFVPTFELVVEGAKRPRTS